MAKLGLLPPYTPEDVEQAYLAKVKAIRPSEADDRIAFYEIQHAYEQAREYVKFHGDRRGWIAKRMEEYVALQDVAARLRQMGAEIETDAIDWLEQSIGDFAELTEMIVGIRLRGVANADDVILYMVNQHQRLLGLRRFDLSGSNVSDASVRQLSVFRRLAEIDLSRTPITWESLHVVAWLPELETVHVEGTRLNLLTRWKLSRQLRRKKKAAALVRVMHPARIG
jgi:hypothetical protein